MKEQINKAALRVRNNYIGFWALPVLIVLIGENCEMMTGAYATSVSGTYLIETIVILLTDFCVPLSLKLFSVVLRHKIDLMTIPQALRHYVLWCLLRLVLLALPMLGGLVAYYLTYSGKGLLCTAIALIASLFCVPGRKRLYKELNLDIPDESLV